MRTVLAGLVVSFSAAALAQALPPSAAVYSDDHSTTLVLACVAKRLSVLIVSADLQRQALKPEQPGSVVIDAATPRPITWNGINGAGLQTFDDAIVQSMFTAGSITVETGLTGPLSFDMRGSAPQMFRVSATCGPSY